MKRIENARKAAVGVIPLLALLFWLGLLAGASSVLQMDEPWLDERVVLERAEAIRGGQLFDSTGGWIQPPLYGYLLAALGGSTSSSGLSPWAPWRLAQVGAWLGALFGLAMLGRRSLGAWWGLVPPAFFFLSAETWFLALRPLPEIWLCLAATLCLIFAGRPGISGSLAGLAVGFRGTALALCVAPALRNRRTLLFAAVPLFVLTAGHSVKWGGLTGPSNNAGINLYIGNGPTANGFYRTGREYDFANDPTGRDWLVALGGEAGDDARQRDAAWRRLALGEMLRNPPRTLGLLLRKLHLQVAAISIPQIDSVESWKEQLPLMRAFILPYGVLSSLAMVGLLARGVPRRDDTLRWTLLSLLLSGALFFVVGRFRLVLYPALCVLAGIGLHDLLVARGRAILRGAGLAAVAALLVWPWGLEAESASLREGARATLALRFEQRAREEFAARDMSALLSTLDRWHSLESAGPLDTSSAALRLKLLGDAGRVEEAVRYGNALVARQPDNPAVVLGLGSALARSGRLEEAERLLAAAAEKWPEDMALQGLLRNVREDQSP